MGLRIHRCCRNATDAMERPTHEAGVASMGRHLHLLASRAVLGDQRDLTDSSLMLPIVV